MAKLVWQVPGQAPLAFPLRHERISVGRDAGNDLRLPEPAVSARHAALFVRGDRVTVEDLDSSNGTWVNGSRIRSQELVHGDTVAFGRVAMRFVDEAPVAAEPKLAATLPRPALAADAEPEVPQLPQDGDTRPQMADGGPDLQELDRLLGSIRSFREQEEDAQRRRQAELLREWRTTLAYAEAMKTRLASESRIRYFEVSERRHEIVLRVVRSESQPNRLLSLTWGHPDQRDKAPDGIWIRASGLQDRRYEKSADAVRELVSQLALFLT